MKTLNHYISEAERIPCLHVYITEKFRLSRDNITSNLVPKNFSELQHIISDKIGESNILDMDFLADRLGISDKLQALPDKGKPAGELLETDTDKYPWMAMPDDADLDI